jgi:Lon protease-like protein
LANGLLGISIEGQHRFDIESTWREPDGLIKAKVVFHDAPQLAPLPDDQVGLAEVLTGLLRHPQIKQLNLQADPSDAWRVCWQLAQLLPLDEAIKYELLGIVSVDQLLDKMDKLLKEISGEES